MPSPLAHSSLLLAVAPPLRARLRALTRGRRWLFQAAVVFALLAPDLDIALGLVLGAGPFKLHGGPTHSLLLAGLFGVVWAVLVRGLVFPPRSNPPGDHLGDAALPWGWLWVIGTGAYASHVLMDWLTPGRGVGLWWPINADRVGSPIYLFVGVEHSNWKDVGHHALTLVTELGFAALMAALGWALARCVRPSDTAGPVRSGVTT